MTVRKRSTPVFCKTIPIRGSILARSRPGVEAEDADLAAVPLPVALEDLDRRGLARAVGAEQREDLAGLDVQVDAAYRLEPAVGLDKSPHPHDGRAARHGLRRNQLDEAGSGVGGQRLAAELIHDRQVVLDVGTLLQVDGAGELLHVHHVGQVLLLEAQDGERPARAGVTAAVERHDLEGDLRQRRPPRGGGEAGHASRPAPPTGRRSTASSMTDQIRGGSALVSRSWRLTRSPTRRSISSGGAAWWPRRVTALA